VGRWVFPPPLVERVYDRTILDAWKAWLVVQDAAVMTVLFLVFGAS
jgi:hypothetical protein